MTIDTTTAGDGTVRGTLDAAMRWVDAFNSGDVETLRDAFTPDATWWLPGDLPVAGTYVGRDAVMDDFLAKGIGLFEPGTLRFEVIDAIAQGDRVALEIEAHGRSAAGEEYHNHYLFLLAVVDGRVGAVREYVDTLYASRVLWPTAT